MSRRHRVKVEFAIRFPRVSGDEPRRFLIVEVTEKFSPRERG